LQLDVFTLVPHAFSWLTEQRPVAAVLGVLIRFGLSRYHESGLYRLSSSAERSP